MINLCFPGVGVCRNRTNRANGTNEVEDSDIDTAGIYRTGKVNGADGAKDLNIGIANVDGMDGVDRTDRLEDLNTGTAGANKTDGVENSDTSIVGADGANRADRAEDPDIGTAGVNGVDGVEDPDTDTVRADVEEDRRRPPTDGQIVTRYLVSRAFFYSFQLFFLFFFPSLESEISFSSLVSASTSLLSFIDISIKQDNSSSK